MTLEESKEAFLQYLCQKGRKQVYIDMSRELLSSFYGMLGNEQPSSKAIDLFVRKRWSGYVSKDKDTYRILNEYADFCKAKIPSLTSAFHRHIHETFEGEARKAMRAYKNSLVLIPKDAIIDPCFLDGLSQDEFINGFHSLQEVVYAIYDDIEHNSPFDWGWSDWRSITWEGLNHNRIMLIFDALVGSGHLNAEGILVVDKKLFGKHDICRPITKTKLTLYKLIDKGFCIENFDHTQSPFFTVSYPHTQNLIKILYAYFKDRYSDCHNHCKNHVDIFSYRFVEAPATQNKELYFLAKTDGEPPELRKIYDWLYDEAVKYGYCPKGYENMGCYVYQKGEDEWLLLGRGPSYHEDEFLHSVSYKIAAKCRFHRVFQTHPEKIADLMMRFPNSFGRPWTQCFRCKTKADHCKSRVTLKKGNQDYHHCATKFYLFFHDPSFDDVKAIYELFQLENNLQEVK